ncbi:MAG: trypsin-like peptidase domain-containing protein [Rhodospirillales bacterium]
MQVQVTTASCRPRSSARGIGAAAGIVAAVMAVGVPAGNSASAADPHLGVVSSGKIIPPAKAPPVSPSSPGAAATAAGEVAPADQLAEFKAIAESAEEMNRLLNLRPMTAAVGAESIVGPDNRVRVTPTTTSPTRATVLIIFSAGRCSGWLIGANTVVTAGHCVHSGRGGAFYPTSSYLIYPGRNGGGSPYGSCGARWLATTQAWTNYEDDRYDYAAIKLNCAIGNTVGWYGFFVQNGPLNGLPTNINGYPGDKALTQWRSSDRVRLTQPQRVFYQNDTVGGMSGSPVWYNRPGCGPCAMAVHAYGVYNSPPSPFAANNHGTRITQAAANNLVAWRAAP